MVKFKEEAFYKEDYIFLKEDPARIYRGYKDLMVEELNVDRIEEGHMEFNVSKPKDTLRIHAFKEKSPHTVIKYRTSLRSKVPRDIYKKDRPDDIMKARMKVEASVVTVYPGADPISWWPGGESELWDFRHGIPGLESEEKSAFQRSKLYEILVGIWYNVFYSKQITMYKEEAEEDCLRFINLSREKFGIEESIRRSGASQYQPPYR